mmetsp:Transcript_3126/g.7240  ORF Transcript_3126/g.7240 Transcript_3126/m.7240 type:complete len:290 (+) Transcript_3126:978-1847(+)
MSSRNDTRQLKSRGTKLGSLRIMPGARSRASVSVTRNSVARCRVPSSRSLCSATVSMASTTWLRCLRTKRGSFSASSTNMPSASCAEDSSLPCSAPPRVWSMAGSRSWNLARSAGFSSAPTKQHEARRAASLTLMSPLCRHWPMIPCSMARCGTRLSPMYSASCAKMLSALSFRMSVPLVTHWNRKGSSSGHMPSSKMPAASSHTVSHTLRVMLLACSSCRLFSSSALMPCWVCGWRLAHSDTSSLVMTRRRRMEAISRVSVAADVRIARMSCRHSMSGCFLLSLKMAS